MQDKINVMNVLYRYRTNPLIWEKGNIVPSLEWNHPELNEKSFFYSLWYRGSTIEEGAMTTVVRKNVGRKEHNLKYLEKSSRIYRDFQRFRSGILSKQYEK